jgi:hypothetical protein
MRNSQAIPILCLAAFPAMLYADIIVNESNPKNGVSLGIDLKMNDQPALGYLVLCEGKLNDAGTACFPGDPANGLPQVGTSDVIQWLSVTTGVDTEWFAKVYSDLPGNDPNDTEPNLIDDLPTFHEPTFTCPQGSTCVFRREPGLGDFGGPDGTNPETISYTAKAGDPGFVPNDAGFTPLRVTRAIRPFLNRPQEFQSPLSLSQR